MKDKDKDKEEKTKKERKGQRRAWLNDTLTLPLEMLGGGVYLEMRGQGVLFVRGCLHILGYAPQEMVLAVRGARLHIRGQGLLCTTYRGGAVEINGRVEAIFFDKGEGKE